MITEELIEATWHSTKSIAEIAKKFKVKPAEVRQAFDIALSRQPKTSDEELAARRTAHITATKSPRSFSEQKAAENSARKPRMI